MQNKSSGRRKGRAAIAEAAAGGGMPHERDESPARVAGAANPPGQARLMGQAHEDIVRGLQDTDCRAQPVSLDSACLSPAPGAGRSRIARRRRRARARMKARPRNVE